MTEKEFKRRTQTFALDIIRLVRSLPQEYTARTIGRQLMRSGTSVGANYRSACRAKSVADMIAKLSIVEEEADECLYWMTLLSEANMIPERQIRDLKREADALLAMTVASIKTLRERK